MYSTVNRSALSNISSITNFKFPKCDRNRRSSQYCTLDLQSDLRINIVRKNTRLTSVVAQEHGEG